VLYLYASRHGDTYMYIFSPCTLHTIHVSCMLKLFYIFVHNMWSKNCLFICFESHEQLFSYLATVTITDNRAANLDLCLALAAFSSEGSFYMSHLLRYRTSLFKVTSERPVILTSRRRALGEGAITTYFKRLRFDVAGPSGAQTHDLPGAKREHYH
jgi:hypothetical protein